MLNHSRIIDHSELCWGGGGREDVDGEILVFVYQLDYLGFVYVGNIVGCLLRVDGVDWNPNLQCLGILARMVKLHHAHFPLPHITLHHPTINIRCNHRKPHIILCFHFLLHNVNRPKRDFQVLVVDLGGYFPAVSGELLLRAVHREEFYVGGGLGSGGR